MIRYEFHVNLYHNNRVSIFGNHPKKKNWVYRNVKSLNAVPQIYYEGNRT